MSDLRADKVVLGAIEAESFVHRGSSLVYKSDLDELHKIRENVLYPERLLYC